MKKFFWLLSFLITINLCLGQNDTKSYSAPLSIDSPSTPQKGDVSMERLNKGKLQLFDLIKKDGYGYGQKTYSAIFSTLTSKGYSLESHKREEVMAWLGPDPEPTGEYYDEWSFIFLRDPEDKNSVLYRIYGDECVIIVTIFDDRLLKDFKKEVDKIKNNLENVYYESNKVGLVFCYGD